MIINATIQFAHLHSGPWPAQNPNTICMKKLTKTEKGIDQVADGLLGEGAYGGGIEAGGDPGGAMDAVGAARIGTERCDTK